LAVAVCCGQEEPLANIIILLNIVDDRKNNGQMMLRALNIV
jgi:hypothetical protein